MTDQKSDMLKEALAIQKQAKETDINRKKPTFIQADLDVVKAYFKGELSLNTIKKIKGYKTLVSSYIYIVRVIKDFGVDNLFEK